MRTKTLQADQIILDGKYRVIDLIGQGAMARVWLAEETAFGQRPVAIKEPRGDLTQRQQEELTERYEREIRVCAALEQAEVPNRVRAITVEPFQGRHLLVMEYMPGGDLRQLLDAEGEGGLEIARALQIALDVLGALGGAHAHPLEIVHRDVKPANILFGRDGRARLGDFGFAQLAGASTGRSKLTGGPQPDTPLYMAPEQETQSGYVSPAADLFALGCTLFEMLTGQRYKRRPPGTAPGDLRSDVPDWLDHTLLLALARDPYQRCQTAADMSQALNEREVTSVELEQARRRASKYVPAGTSSSGEEPASRRAGRRWLVILPITAVLAGSLLLGARLWNGEGMTRFSEPTPTKTPTSVLTEAPRQVQLLQTTPTAPQSTPTQEPLPTYTIPPTYTPYPTSTSVPVTDTPRAPTNTPINTFTPSPTPTVPTPTPTRIKVYFEDDFEGGEMKDAWEVAAGDWRVINGMLTTVDRESQSLLYVGSEDWSDYSVDLSLQEGSSPDLWLYLRCQDRGNGAVFHICDHCDWGRGFATLSIMENGQEEILWETGREIPGHLRTEVAGDIYRVFMEDEEILEINDKTYPTGRFGIAIKEYGGKGEYLGIDSVEVKAIY